MLAHEKRRNWDNRSSYMDPAPLFEREHRQEGQYVQRLQDELSDTKGLLEAQARRQCELEYVNEDLERRLEIEAKEKNQLEALVADQKDQMSKHHETLVQERQGWQKRCGEEIRRREIIEERLRRAEKELYRMHQKKYDIEKNCRQEEHQKRSQEAHIVREIREESQRNHQRPTQVNPRYIQPKTIRTRRAYQAVLDFFGMSNNN